MNIYPLVFSNNNNYRITRHAIFWSVWIIYYTAISTYGLGPDHPLKDRFFSSLLEVALSTPLDMIFCYAIIYFLLPKFLFKGRYISMILLWILFSMIFIAVYELYIAEVVGLIRQNFNLKKPGMKSSYFWMFFSLFSQINMEGCIAAAIKLGKITFIKQQEIDLLRNEKAKAQTHMDKVAIQPLFLADIISRFEQMAAHKKLNVSEVLKKISTLMINFIYENANAKVSLKKELELVTQYIELEQRTREELIDVDLSVSGNIESETIASFILLQFMQNAFSQVTVLEVSDKKIDAKVNVINRVLDVLISWNKPLYTSTLVQGTNVILQNLSNRLKLIYPQSHEMKVLIEADKIFMSLKIDLKGAIN